LAEEDLLHLAPRLRAIAVVEEHHLDAAVRHRVVQDHALVKVPALDHAGIHGGEVDLAEAREPGIARAQHVQDAAALVGDAAQRLHHNAFDHRRAPVTDGRGAPRNPRYHSTVSASAASSAQVARQPSTLFAREESRYWSRISATAVLRMSGLSAVPITRLTAATISSTLSGFSAEKLNASPRTSGRSTCSARSRYAETTSFT